MLGFAAVTLPVSGFQVYQSVQLSTGGTGFGSRFPPVNVDNLLVVLLRLMLEFLMERIGCDIRYLPSPEAFHAFKREGFKHQYIVSQHKMLGKFPEQDFQEKYTGFSGLRKASPQTCFS